MYNVESDSDPVGLVRRDDEGSIIEFIHIKDADRKFGCATWEDIMVLIELAQRCEESMLQ